MTDYQPASLQEEVETVIAHHVDPIPVRIMGDETENVHDVAARWAPHTFGIPINAQPFPIAGKNPQRKRLYVYADPTNNGAVQLSASNTGVPSIAMFANSPALEMTHSDSVYVTTAATLATLYVFEEMYL